MQPPSAAIETQNLTRRFGPVVALDAVTLTIAQGEFFSLLGPSGCGKTTLLRLIAGLDMPDTGSLLLHGENALDLPAHRRSVNTVFQSYALFPHMTVHDNIAFGLKMKKVFPSEIASRVERALKIVEIEGLGRRKPSQLSGGQKQRVALARAVVNEPRVLLLDEPLGALDLKLRKQLQIELRQLQRRLGITFVYVTHDQEEAMVMSDRIAVMNRGRIEQIGIPNEIYDRPRTKFVAEFLGSCNLIKAKVLSSGFVKTAWGDWRVETPCEVGEEILLTIRPENIRLQPASNSGNCGDGAVVSVFCSGSQIHYEVESNGQLLKITVMNAVEDHQFQKGETVSFGVSATALRILKS
jgi:spermidine/putrescine transport system ATP-binding protein